LNEAIRKKKKKQIYCSIVMEKHNMNKQKSHFPLSQFDAVGPVNQMAEVTVKQKRRPKYKLGPPQR
jgi:hypothetical protein